MTLLSKGGNMVHSSRKCLNCCLALRKVTAKRQVFF